MSETRDITMGRIRFQCSQCHHVIAAPPELARKKCRCPHCGAINDVPPPESLPTNNLPAPGPVVQTPSPPESIEIPLEDDNDDSGIEIEPAPPPSTGPAPAAGPQIGMRTAAAKPRITQVGKSEPGVKEQMKPMTGQREVRSFVGKLREDMNDPLHGTPHSIQDVDRQINEWLEQYPQYDVTSVTSAVGELRSKKGNEHVLILTVWFQRRADQ